MFMYTFLHFPFPELCGCLISLGGLGMQTCHSLSPNQLFNPLPHCLTLHSYPPPPLPGQAFTPPKTFNTTNHHSRDVQRAAIAPTLSAHDRLVSNAPGHLGRLHFPCAKFFALQVKVWRKYVGWTAMNLPGAGNLSSPGSLKLCTPLPTNHLYFFISNIALL